MHKQKASLIALDVWRFADTLVDQTERSILGAMAVNLAARLSAMDQVSEQAEQRRLRLVKLARRLLQQISAKFIVTSLPCLVRLLSSRYTVSQTRYQCRCH